MSDTIAAISTGNVVAGIGILRLSGSDAISIVDKVFKPLFSSVPMCARPDRMLVYGELCDKNGERIDICLCTVSRAPHSYTGEDTAELQCHGSPTVLREGLEALFAAGARQAKAGEFSRRAFLNGCMDLTQAEAVIDLIHAETAEAAKNAAGQLGGAIVRRTDAVYDLLKDISAHYHAVIDYPDEDIEDFSLWGYIDNLKNAETTLERLARSFERGRVMVGGVPTAIVGRPNAGKSSLMNALLGYERVIVTDIPGTTRDTVSERIRFGGTLLNLTDTAGVRDTTDAVEALGVERSREVMRSAGLIFVLCDSAVPFTQEDAALLEEAVATAPTVLVWTKSDLPAAPVPYLNFDPMPEVVEISSVTGEGMEALEAAVAALFPVQESFSAGEILTNARQADAVKRALQSVRAALEAMESGLTPDAVLTESEEAMEALGELTGKTVREDITDRIFARFCVGK
ncbi:MAG: tRNA uridine-5-carboxymethylaminomethyl(34) synthesis GTPase MnmE [Ruminococcaceae bacterium]|nr:tRNA uridine-5-carboxymethylaminomethyl(34) synthesis GTPase MnmE [Oscillospiraceae bacterium]